MNLLKRKSEALGNEQLEPSNNKSVKRIGALLYLILFFGCAVIQKMLGSSSIYMGVLSQVQVILSVFVVIFLKRTGYWIAALSNLTIFLYLGYLYFQKGLTAVLPGVVIPVNTFIILNILAFYLLRLNRRLQLVESQKSQIEDLHQEVTLQNQQLQRYNELLEENELKLKQLAYIDALTGLPSRSRMLELMGAVIDEKRINQEIAVVFIDLDNFKSVNDTRGHHIGDILLQGVSERLKAAVEPDDLLGRLGGDEFAWMVSRQVSEEQLQWDLERVRKRLQEPMVIFDERIGVSASMGVSLYPKDGDTITDLLKAADIAMYRAKDAGGNQIHFYSEL